MSIEKGALYVVATPIGNLDDMSPRAIEVLSGVDQIAAEDTRHSKPLLLHFGINTPCQAVHEHNERIIAGKLVKRLEDGESVALISDAGTPLISDPGYHLVSAVQHAGYRIIPVPGPSAMIAALSVSGLPSDRFIFEGFLPAKSAARQRHLETLAGEPRTLIFYEAPHRILETIRDMVVVFGNGRRAVIARELTKLFETVYGGTLEHLLDWVEQDENQQKGEIVLLVHGADRAAEDVDMEEYRRILQILLEEMSLKQAVKLAVAITGIKKNLLYDLAIQIKQTK